MWTVPFLKDGTASKERSPWPQSGNQGKSFEGKESRAERLPLPQRKRSKYHPHSQGPVPWGSAGSPYVLVRAPPGETSLSTMPSLSSPYYGVSHEEDRRQWCTCVHCGCQGHWAPDHRGCQEALWHWLGQGQHPNQAWWREGAYWLPTMILWMLPTKLGSFYLSWLIQNIIYFLL